MKSNKIIIIATVAAIICLFNSVADADRNSCKNKGNLDLSALLKHWWLVAFAINEKITINCGRFSVYKYTNNNENANKFYGFWTSRNGSTSKEYIDVTGELNNYVADIKGLNHGNESEPVDIIMCNDNTEMIWKRHDPLTYFLLSMKATGSQEILKKYKFITESESLLYQTVNNTDCVH